VEGARSKNSADTQSSDIAHGKENHVLDLTVSKGLSPRAIRARDDDEGSSWLIEIDPKNKKYFWRPRGRFASTPGVSCPFNKAGVDTSSQS